MGLFGPIISWAHPRHSVAGVVASLALSLFAWPLLTAAAHSPDAGGFVQPARASTDPAPQLIHEGDQVVLTGSVAMLFDTGFFSGPNRAEKVNRARLTPDGVTVSSGFADVRARLAALRSPPAPGASAPARATPAGDPAVQVASIDPDQSAALGAIDQVVPLAPMPMTPSATLAYARETTPATPFDLTVDKFGGKVSQKDIWCMATAIYFEARGESYRGQIAVGQVVMNRLAHRLYPNTICGVVFQNESIRNGCQFSFACDGIPETINDPKAFKQANEIARGVINGTLYLAEIGKATHYHATYVYPDWAPHLTRVARIGHHIFYKFKRA